MCSHAITLIRTRPASGSLVYSFSLAVCVAVAQDLDRRAGQDGGVEPDVRFGDSDADALCRRMILQDRRRYPLGDRLGQVDGFPLDDLPRPPMHLAVVYGLGQVVGETRGSQVQPQLHVHDEGLAQLALGGQRAVAAVEDHALKQYPVLSIFFTLGHLTQYKGP